MANQEGVIGEHGACKETDFEELNLKMAEVAAIQKKMEMIERSAGLRSKVLGVGLSGALFAQLYIIGMGTFNWLSWDIMEPISYLFMLGNFTLGFGWYTAFIQDPSKQNPVDWFKERSKEAQ